MRHRVEFGSREGVETRQKRMKKRLAGRLAAVLAYLVAFDISANLVFRYPDDSSATSPTTFQQYFEYGRSTEGKLARLKPGSSGWGKRSSQNSETYLEGVADNDAPVIAFYGMSHTAGLARAVASTSRRYRVQLFNAPGATPNWAFAAFQEDLEKGDRPLAAVLGVMTEGVPFITTTSGATMHFDAGYPYTYPRYYLREGRLVAEYPPFLDYEGFRRCFEDPARWAQYRVWLSRNDAFYDPILFRGGPLDASCIVRLMRRTYAVRTREARVSRVLDSKGLVPGTEELALLGAIATEFAESARAQGVIPIVYLINNQGRGDTLFRVLLPVLEAREIPYLSTHVICPPDDPAAFQPGADGHFADAKEIELAGALVSVLEHERSKRPPTR